MWWFVCVSASRVNLPAQNTMLTILNALPLACAKSSVGSTHVGFVMALVGVPVKELLDNVGYWRRTRVPRACQRAASVKKHNRATTTTVVQVLFRWDVFEVDPPNPESHIKLTRRGGSSQLWPNICLSNINLTIHKHLCPVLGINCVCALTFDPSFFWQVCSYVRDLGKKNSRTHHGYKVGIYRTRD